MHGQFFSGVLDKSGRPIVMRYKADPQVREISAVQDSLWWGREATLRQRLALSAHLLGGHHVPAHIVREYADEVLLNLDSRKMWILSAESVHDWLSGRLTAVA